MNERIIVCVGLAAVLVGGDLAFAQGSAPAADGDRVRLTAAVLPARVIGRVVMDRNAVDFVTVSVGDGDATLSMPLAGISRLEISRGRQRGRTAAIGAAVGFAIGGLTGAAIAGDEWLGGSLVTAALGSTGAVIGGSAGYAYAPERWRTARTGVAMSGSYRLVVRPGARIRRLDDGTILVRGERDRRKGMARGALVLGGLALVAGGIEKSRGEIGGGEFAGMVASNALVGAAIGYLISPRGWQPLPRPTQ